MSLSQTRVPRDAGAGTRCPVEYRLTQSSEDWRAQVSIRLEYDSEGNRLHNIKEILFGEVITKPGNVELQLRRAQCAVLSTDVNFDAFLTKSAEELGAMSGSFAKSSNNTVCIDMSGPELTNLDFVDLPGE